MIMERTTLSLSLSPLNGAEFFPVNGEAEVVREKTRSSVFARHGSGEPTVAAAQGCQIGQIMLTKVRQIILKVTIWRIVRVWTSWRGFPKRLANSPLIDFVHFNQIWKITAR